MGSTAEGMRAASRRRRRNRISEAWTSHTVSMLRSPARRVLSRAAQQFLDRLEIELCDHGGNDNGRLPLTFADLVEHGIHRNSISVSVSDVEIRPGFRYRFLDFAFAMACCPRLIACGFLSARAAAAKTRYRIPSLLG
jgi:hypothetical protein